MKNWKKLIHIAWPLIVANSFWNLQMTIDRIFLGQLSTDALGAAIAVFGVFWAPMALVQQTAAYVTTFVAQLFGAKRFNEIGSVYWQSILIGSVGGFLFLGLIPLAPIIFSSIGHAEKIRPLEVDYFVSMCFSALPTALVASASGFFTGLGRSSVILWINAIGLVVNAIFDYFLIFGKGGFPRMGIAGAGYATVIGTWASAFLGLWLVSRSDSDAVFGMRRSFGFNLFWIKKVLKYGVPSGLQWALEGLAFTAFLVIVGQFENGTAALAGSGIAVTVMMLSVLPVLGMAQGVAALVGQSLGADNPTKAEQFAWSGVSMSLVYIVLLGTTFVLFPGFYLQWFKSSDNLSNWDEVSTIVKYLLVYVAVFTMFDCMNLVFSFTLKAAGDTKFVSLLALIVPWPTMVLPAFLMRHYNGAVYYAWGAASFFIMLQAVLFLIRFKTGRWKNMRVIGNT